MRVIKARAAPATAVRGMVNRRGYLARYRGAVMRHGSHSAVWRAGAAKAVPVIAMNLAIGALAGARWPWSTSRPQVHSGVSLANGRGKRDDASMKPASEE